MHTKFTVDVRAASIINRFYTVHVHPKSTMMLAKIFLSKGTSLKEANALGFDFFIERIQCDGVTRAAGPMLLRLFNLARLKKNGTPLLLGKMNVDIFLYAYVIASYTQHVFEDRTKCMESAVMEVCEPMLRCLHSTLEELAKGTSWHKVHETTAKNIFVLMKGFFITFKVYSDYSCFIYCNG